MLEVPKRMSTSLLRKNIDRAINNLLPYFQVTEDELKKFQRPYLRRTLKPSEYEEHPRSVPAYSSIDNFFYFPLEDSQEYTSLVDYLSYGIFSQAVIYHECGHYIHYSINPRMQEGVLLCLEEGKRPEGHDDLSELVAEYGNLILNIRENKENLSRRTIEVYENYGPAFLSRLARMSLEEVIEEGIIIV